MKLELTESEIALLKIALQRAAFREAEIAIDLQIENTIGPKFIALRDEIIVQQTKQS